MTELRGIHVLCGFALAFGLIIAVNITLAVNAVRTFPGLETRNSYVASQAFDRARAAQEALGWDVRAVLEGGALRLVITDAHGPVAPIIESATFGRATTVAQDQSPVFTYRDGAFVALVTGGPGNWNLRLVARAGDGSRFAQRIIVEVVR